MRDALTPVFEHELRELVPKLIERRVFLEDAGEHLYVKPGAWRSGCGRSADPRAMFFREAYPPSSSPGAGRLSCAGATCGKPKGLSGGQDLHQLSPWQR